MFYLAERLQINMEKGKIMGYARVSSSGQHLDRQILELRKYVPEGQIVVDKMSGKNLDRPGYQALKGPLGLRRGDTLYIKSLDRLSRTKADIRSELVWFQEHGISLRILDLPTTLLKLESGQEWIQDMVNNILIEVMSSLAEQERVMIRQRQREGIAAAKAAGKHLGRPHIQKPKEWDAVIGEWKAGRITAKDAMKKLGLKRSSFYAMVRSSEV